MKKLYSEKQISVSAFLAGPLPPGFLIYLNYKALGKEKQAYIALALSLLITITLFYTLFLLPQDIIDRIPSITYSSIYAAFIFVFFRKYLAKDVDEALENGVGKGSNWVVASVSLAGLVLSLAIIFGLATDQPVYDTEVTDVNGNEIYYDAHVPMENVYKLAGQLRQNDFFGKDYGNVARLQLTNNEYVITLMVDEQFWSDQDVINTLTSLKWIMEAEFDTDIQLKLESVSLSGMSTFKKL